MFRVFTCLTGEHDLRLVVLAGVVCFLASLTAINLFRRARARTKRARAVWSVTAGIATGCGIWATHFVAMLAYDPGIAIGYDIILTALSLVAAVSITSIGLGAAVYIPSRIGTLVGGGIVGAGVASMHYIGMWALEVPGRVTWSSDLVLTSIVLGMLFGAAALSAARLEGAPATLGAAILLTLAIVSHHFTAMGAVEIVPDPTRIISQFSLSPTALAMAVAGAAVGILGLSFAGALADGRLRERDVQLITAVNNMPQGLIMFDAAERIVVCNDRYIEMYSLSRDIAKPGTTLRDIIKNRFATGTLARDPEEYRSALLAAIAKGETTSWIVESPDGRAIAVTNRPTGDGAWVATHEDVTERQRMLEAQQRTEEIVRGQKLQLDTALNNMSQGLCMFDADGRIVLFNERYTQMMGLSSASLMGRSLLDLFKYRKASGEFVGDPEEFFARVIAGVREGKSSTKIMETSAGRALRVADQPMPGGGWVATFEDISDWREAQAKIAHMAHHDALTNLPNRTLFREQLDHALRRISRNDRVAVFCIDLDHFKDVNDSLGHPIGDDLLKEVAHRLSECIREGDTVSRLGGDEFAIVQAGNGLQVSEVSTLASRLIEVVGAPYIIQGHQVIVGTSIGISVAPDDGTDPDQLLKNADMALYRAKADGRGTYRFFEIGMDARAQARRLLELDLRAALTRGEFEVYYQPIHNLNSGQIICFEALVRWNHPLRGMIPPANFISLAEETGLIIPIGDWVLRTACMEATRWSQDVRVAVNLSPVQFKKRDLVTSVIAALSASGLVADRLELEITESVLLNDSEATLATLHKLRDFGIRISMDDFGTGYSSLSYLRSFPFDKIKIDRSFVHELATRGDSMAIVRAVTGLGKSLGITTTAEGVETAEELALLRAEGCNEVQGYLFSRPLPAAEVEKMLSRGQLSMAMSA